MKNSALNSLALRLNYSESDRLYSLKEYQVLDTPQEKTFDNLTEIAARVTGCEFAGIGFIDESRYWFKSIYGAHFTELPRCSTICNLAITKPEVYEISDLSENPLARQVVGTRNIPYRLYTAVPLINGEGYALGTLCVMDKKPGKLSTEKLQILLLLAQNVMERLEQRRREVIQRESIMSRSERLITSHMRQLKQNDKLSKVKKELKKQTTLLESVLNSSPHLISLIDSRGRYRMVNQAAADFLQLPIAEMIGKKVVDLMHPMPDSAQHNNATYKKVIATGQASEVFEDHAQRNGKVFFFQTVMIPIKDEKNRTMVLKVSTDVTVNKSMQLNLNTRNKELEKLIYSLSHDLRGPISSIQGVLNIAEYSGQTDLQEYLKMIRDQTLKLDASIHDLVQLKNITNRKIVSTKISVHHTISEIIEDFGHKGVSIELSCRKKLNFRTDKFFLGTALQSLLKNSTHYHIPDADSARVWIEVKKTIEGIEILIGDNGTGISSKALPRVFEMFYRGSNYSDGHGLGLYIAKSAVDRMKGSIFLESEEGQGTEVRLVLPRLIGNSTLEEF